MRTWQLVTCQQVPLTSCQNIYQHSSAGHWWFPITPRPFDCLIEEVELLSLAAGSVWENSLWAGRARRHVEAGPGREEGGGELRSHSNCSRNFLCSCSVWWFIWHLIQADWQHDENKMRFKHRWFLKQDPGTFRTPWGILFSDQTLNP